MKSLPSDLGGASEEDTSGNTLAALQALVYEGEPAGAYQPQDALFCRVLTSLSRLFVEIAAGFREQGNELFGKRKFKEAIGFYSRALDEVGKDLPVADRRTLWSNRAAANLELGAFDVTAA